MSDSPSPVAGPSTPRLPANIPAGNHPISAPTPVDPADLATGDWRKDAVAAVKRIRPIEDLKNIGSIPCARQSLLTGIAGGMGFGAVTFLSRRRPMQAANISVASFIGLSTLMWWNCQAKRKREREQARIIEERFAHRHVSKLRRKDSTSPSTTASAETGPITDATEPRI